MRSHTKLVAASVSAALLLALLAGGAVYAANNYGTESDPLITLSYLNEVYEPELLSQLSAASATPAGTYVSLTLTAGQTLTGGAGCTVLLRTGALTVTGSGTLSDTTSGSELGTGAAPETNHLIMFPASGAALTCASAGAEVLICGSYTVR